MAATHSTYQYTTDLGQETIDSSGLIELLLQGKIDLPTPVLAPRGTLPIPLEQHPEILHALLERDPDPAEIAAPELSERLRSGRCLHCPRKGARRFTRHRIQSTLTSCETQLFDLACPACLARRTWKDTLLSTFTGWWGWPGLYRTPFVLGCNLLTLWRSGPAPMGGLRAGIGILAALLPFLIIGTLSFLMQEQTHRQSIEQARILLQEGRAEEAALLLDKTIASKQGEVEPVLYHLRGQALLALGRPEAAAKAFGRAEGLPGALIGRAEALRAAGRHVGALDAYRAALKKHPTFGLHKAYQNLGLQMGQRLDLQEEYRRRAEESPDDPMAQYLHGRLQRDPGQRLKAMQTTLSLDPQFASALQIAAPAAIRLGLAEEAEQLLDRARTLQEAGKIGWGDLVAGDCLIEGGQLQKAAQLLRLRSDQGGTRIENFPLLFEALLGLEQHTEAGESLEQFILLRQGNDPSVAYYRGLLARHRGQHEAALAAFEQMFASVPPRSRAAELARREIVRTHLEANDLDGAIRILDAAASAPPARFDSPYWIACHRALALALGGRWKELSGWIRDVRGDLHTFANTSSHGACLELLSGTEDIAAFTSRESALVRRTLQNDLLLYAALAASIRQRPEQARNLYRSAIEASRGQDFPRRLAERLLGE